MFRIIAAAVALVLTLAACDGGSSTTPTTTTTSAPPVSASVLSLSVSIIEQNSVFWRYSWIARVQANRPGTCFIRTLYFDAGGRQLHDGIASLNVTAGAADYTGNDLVQTALAPSVTNARAEISSCSG